MRVGDTFPSNVRWSFYDVMEIDQKEFRKRNKHNGIAKLIWHGLFGGNTKTLPMVYINGLPTEDTPEREKYPILRPKGRGGLLSATALAAKHGYLTRSFYAYLVTPSPSFFEGLSVKAYGLWQDVVDKKITVKSAEGKIEDFVNREADKIVLGRIVIRANSRSTRKEWTSFQVSADMGSREIMRWGGLAVGTSNLPAQEKEKLTTGVSPSNREPDVRSAATLNYYAGAWKLFQKFVTSPRTPEGPIAQLHKALNVGAVREGYDTANTPHKREPEGTPEVPKEKDRPTFRKQEYNRSKVVPSRPVTGGGDAANFVTAKTSEKIWQNAQGVYVVPKGMNKRSMGRLQPVSTVAPLVETGEFKIIFGIVYDHPLFNAKLKDQIWWYANRNQFIASAKEYATMFGDQAHLAYRIIPKKGKLANTYISKNVFSSQFTSPEVNETTLELGRLVQSFIRAGKEGQRQYPVIVQKRLGITEKDIRDTDKGERPESVTPEAWVEYLRWVRRQTRGVLGLNIMASIPKKYVDLKTGKLKPLQFSRYDQKARIGRKVTDRMTGEKDAKGKAIEPWGLYLIQYLLAYKANRSMSGATFMIPLNVLRATKVELSPRNSLKRINAVSLKKLLREHYNKYRFLSDGNWHFIRAETHLHFPFARLIRPMVVVSKEKLEKINRKISYPGIKRTHHGYEIDGIEYSAYAMVVAMPPSVADKEFGLLNRQAYARQIIDEPEMVYRLRRTIRGHRQSMRDMGLTNVYLKLQGLTDEDPDVMMGKSPGTSFHTKKSLAGTDPTDVLGKTQSDLAAGYYGKYNEIGKRWEPIIKEVFDKMGNIVKRSITGYQVANDPADKQRLYLQYANDAYNLYPEVRTYFKRYLMAIANVKPTPGTELGEMAAAADVFVKYLQREVNPGSGKYYRVPTLINRLGLTEYHAPYGSIHGSTQMMTTKAPSEDVAKLIILHRLLRRSAQNKAVKRLMTVNRFRGRGKLFPDLHGRILAQWASANFMVVASHNPKGVRRIEQRKFYSARSREVQRAAYMGDHRYAKMLRTD